jgi:selenocysteine-specific elongation factor
MDVELRLLGDADCSVRTWARLHVHWGAAHHMAHVVPLSSNSIGPGQRDRAQLVFDRPVCATPGDRYIVRNAQASRTIGGGVVLDPNAAPRRRRGAERHAWLDAIAAMLRAGDPAPLLAQAPLGLAGATLARMTGLPFERLSLPADALCLPTRGPDALPVVILRAHWAVLRDGALAALRKFHESAPDEPGIDGMRLRRMAWPALDDAVLHALVEAMLRDGAVARNGPWLHLPGHAVALTEPESALSAIVLPQLFQGGFDPPWVRDLARINGLPEEQIRLLLRKQMRRGEVCRVVPDLYYHRERVRELAQRLATLAAAHGGVPAAAFRDATGLGRKRAVQVLEFFDRVGYTRRVRDAHVLRGDTAWRNPGHDDASQSGSRAGMPKFRP